MCIQTTDKRSFPRYERDRIGGPAIVVMIIFCLVGEQLAFMSEYYARGLILAFLRTSNFSE